MHDIRRLTVILVAWAAPAAWVAAALFSGPSDGTMISTPTTLVGAPDWGDSVTVERAYGDTPLAEGDQVLLVDDRPLAEWLDDPQNLSVGDTVTYYVQRPSEPLDHKIHVDVRLTRYPLASAAADNLSTLALFTGLLLAGSLVYWRRPGDPAALALLAAGSLTAAAVTSFPLGLGAIDLAGSRGVWPHAAGQLIAALGLGALLVLALVFPQPRPWMRPRLAWLAAVLTPWLAYAAWMAIVLADGSVGLARMAALLAILAPGLLLTVPLIVVGQVDAYLRAASREDRVAQRLVALGLVATAVTITALGVLPSAARGEPLIPWDGLNLLAAPLVGAALIVALLRYRLAEMDGALRRILLQVLVATIVGAAFLATVIAAADLATDTSVSSMVAGGVIAAVLMPMAFGVRRLLRRAVYGDREFPYRVVSRLRQLAPQLRPDQALDEMLSILSRSLRLSYASVEIDGAPPDGAIATSIGQPRGAPTSVVLEAGGVRLGQLQLEVEPDREPFGPRDRRLLEDVGSQVGALAQAITMNRQLQLSRERLVAAREEERRRIRRDLHDGLGPALAALAMKLEVTRDLIDREPVQASSLLDQLAEQTRSGIAEIRRLVDGLRPPTLDQFGLVAALRQHATDHNVAAGSTSKKMVWTIDAAEDVEPLPAAIEVAAYRIVIEAVNNALQHSGARKCGVRLRRRAGDLQIEVADDGAGLPEAPRAGVGLESMRERAEELGGSFEIHTTARGTRILVTLPVSQIEEDTR